MRWRRFLEISFRADGKINTPRATQWNFRKTKDRIFFGMARGVKMLARFRALPLLRIGGNRVFQFQRKLRPLHRREAPPRKLVADNPRHRRLVVVEVTFLTRNALFSAGRGNASCPQHRIRQTPSRVGASARRTRRLCGLGIHGSKNQTRIRSDTGRTLQT